MAGERALIFPNDGKGQEWQNYADG